MISINTGDYSLPGYDSVQISSYLPSVTPKMMMMMMMMMIIIIIILFK
jgi:hypothetical protein